MSEVYGFAKGVVSMKFKTSNTGKVHLMPDPKHGYLPAICGINIMNLKNVVPVSDDTPVTCKKCLY